LGDEQRFDDGCVRRSGQCFDYFEYHAESVPGVDGQYIHGDLRRKLEHEWFGAVSGQRNVWVIVHSFGEFRVVGALGLLILRMEYGGKRIGYLVSSGIVLDVVDRVEHDFVCSLGGTPRRNCWFWQLYILCRKCNWSVVDDGQR
jgi:hypothetical protein